MESLDRDRKFLTQGGVFTDDQIDAYIALKFEEIYKLEHTPHPIEFDTVSYTHLTLPTTPYV